MDSPAAHLHHFMDEVLFKVSKKHEKEERVNMFGLPLSFCGNDNKCHALGTANGTPYARGIDGLLFCIFGDIFGHKNALVQQFLARFLRCIKTYFGDTPGVGSCTCSPLQYKSETKLLVFAIRFILRFLNIVIPGAIVIIPSVGGDKSDGPLQEFTKQFSQGDYDNIHVYILDKNGIHMSTAVVPYNTVWVKFESQMYSRSNRIEELARRIAPFDILGCSTSPRDSYVKFMTLMHKNKAMRYARTSLPDGAELEALQKAHGIGPLLIGAARFHGVENVFDVQEWQVHEYRSFNGRRKEAKIIVANLCELSSYKDLKVEHKSAVEEMSSRVNGIPPACFIIACNGRNASLDELTENDLAKATEVSGQLKGCRDIHYQIAAKTLEIDESELKEEHVPQIQRIGGQLKGCRDIHYQIAAKTLDIDESELKEEHVPQIQRVSSALDRCVHHCPSVGDAISLELLKTAAITLQVDYDLLKDTILKDKDPWALPVVSKEGETLKSSGGSRAAISQSGMPKHGGATTESHQRSAQECPKRKSSSCKLAWNSATRTQNLQPRVKLSDVVIKFVREEKTSTWCLCQ